MLFKVYNQIKTLKYLFKLMKGILRTMLCQFTFRNYRSYRDETELSMQATSMKEFERSLIECPDGQSFLPVAAVYGPNAGGKSNLLEALDYIRAAVARPIRLLSASTDAPEGNRSSIPRCSAFEFDDVSAAKPTEFELYYRAGEHEYRYALSVHADEIVSEGLWRRKLGASRSAMLFEREGTGVELGPTLRKLVTAARFNPSLPYLSFLCINFDAPVIKEAASWFLDGVFLNYNSSYLEQMLEQLLDEDDSPEITRFLRAVDVRIDGFRVEKAPEWRGQRVFVKHEVDGMGYELRLSEESAGTQKLMGLALFLLAALERGGTVVVDELDAKLHPKLLRYVILLFKDPEVNKSGAQLIFSSQDVSTMRNDVFRRDEIWFAARGEGEASQLWSLANIHEANGNLVSKNAAFDKQYLSGRYGADPYLTRIEEWD